MKKVLIAGAALMLAGSIVTAASAEVNLSGDARVRYIGLTDYDRMTDAAGNVNTNGYYDEFDSRVRVVFQAKAKGGAYMKARLRLDDFSQWDDQGWAAYNNDAVHNVWADYAYIGVPMGKVTIAGGRMPASFSKFFSYDGRPTRVKATYKGGGITLVSLVDVKDENTSSAADEWDDNDFMAYGLVAKMKMGDNWNLKGYARYHADAREWSTVATTTSVTVQGVDADGVATTATVDVDGSKTSPFTDKSGFLGAVNLSGKAGTVGIEAEVAYKSADVLGKPDGDDALGAYVNVTMNMGAFTPSFMVGMMQNGYVADDDFGYIMIGSADCITRKSLGNSGGDTVWGSFSANYAVSEQFSLAANFVYVSYDSDATDALSDEIELSGSAKYAISEGASLTYKIGSLTPSYDGSASALGTSDDTYIGQYLELSINF
ncbi:MAG: hypothetical protein KAI39_03580 [Desulfobulbaceae bacterium]|nr:hypothetical protein [Desulfobulbaceae bacterium]